MPFLVKGKSYPLPADANQPGVTGRELIEIEDAFGLDGLQLLGALDGTSKAKGYTRGKAMFALAWVCMTRGGETLSIDDVLNDYSVSDFDIELEDSDPKAETADTPEAAAIEAE